MNTRRSRSSPMSSPTAVSIIGSTDCCAVSSARPSSACLRSRSVLRRSASIARPTFRDGHQPGAWVLRYARVRPLLQRGDEGVRREVFGQPDVAHDPGDPGDHPGRLDPPDRVDHVRTYVGFADHARTYLPQVNGTFVRA